MIITDDIYKGIKKVYNQIDDFTRKRPAEAIIYSVALAAFAVFISPFSSILAIEVFAFSLFFDAAIIKNLQRVCNKIEEQMSEIFKSSKEAARVNGKREGIFIRDQMQKGCAKAQDYYFRAKDFVEELFA